MERKEKTTEKDLKEFFEDTSNWVDEVWDYQRIELPFDLKPREFLDFAKKDINSADSLRTRVNALCNLKRAIHSEIDAILFAFGMYGIHAGSNFPTKLDLLSQLDIIKPSFLERINKKRNVLEHTYKTPPNMEAIKDIYDFTELFLEYCDMYLKKFLFEIYIYQSDGKPDRYEGKILHRLNAKLDPKKGVVLFECDGSKKPLVIKKDSPEYTRYLKYYAKLIKFAQGSV